MSYCSIQPQILAMLQETDAARPRQPDTGGLPAMLAILHAADRKKLARASREHAVEAGQVVFEEGEPGDSLFVIRSGCLAVVKGTDENLTILSFLDAGKVFGEMALLDNRPRSATIVAVRSSRLLEIKRQEFEALLRMNPEVGRGIMGVLSANLRRMSEAHSTGEQSERQLSHRVSALEDENRRLEELERLRQETTELILHDLRNPLGAITMALKMLGLVLPPEVRGSQGEVLEVALGNCERMQRLVDSLLEVSRMESGETVLAMEPVNLGQLIAEVARRGRPLAGDVTVEVDFSPDLPPVCADRDKLDRVLANLLDNALKVSPGQGVVTLAAYADGGWVQVGVCDQGPGVPPEERQRIFERFSQSAGEKGRRRGFGLGLTYCRLTVERHGGRIWVEPGPDGTGSRFRFTLPLVST